MTRLRHWVGCVGILIALVMGSPQIAQACAVCMTGREDENRLAFIVTTAFLTFLPLVLVGSVIWWLRGRARQLEAAAQHPTTSKQAT